MNEKIYIRKEKLDIRIVLFAIMLLFVWNILSILSNNYVIIDIYIRIVGSVLFILIYCGFMLCKAIKKNNITKDGKLIWCKVDRSRSETNVSGIVIRAGYFWKDTNQFVEYTGGVRTMLDSRRDEYAKIMAKVKYVPVFVDQLDRNKYAMVLCDFWSMDKAEVKNPNNIIRIIENCLYEKS